ncbi:MAG: hypothetical protein IT529_22655 [Burkholderiales bacterium]|nr:hypothetical protein [Burkholderiales bacterium]
MVLPLPVPSAGSRARIFLPVFLLACAASLTWVFARPAVYVSTARVQLEAPGRSNPGSEPGSESGALPDVVQSLTGSELVERVAQALGMAPAAARAMLAAAPVPGTSVVELRAEGGEPELPARALEAWIAAWVARHAQSDARAVGAGLEAARAEERDRERDLAARRRDLEEFRRKHGIVSAERDENRAASELKRLTAALAEARSRDLAAESRLAALRGVLAAGKLPAGLPQQAIVADLERRAAELKERMRGLEQEYTPNYLAIDNRYKAMAAGLARIEQQIAAERKVAAAQALHKAEEDLAGARHAVARIEKDLSTRRIETQEFSARFAEHAAIAREVARLDESRAAAAARVTDLAGRAKAVRPRLVVLARPGVPTRPDRPDYWRDALLGVAGSGVLGFLAVWFVEFIRRPAAQAAAPVQPVINISLPSREWEVRESAAPGRLIGAGAAYLPLAAERLPRELSEREVRALWSAAAPDARLAIAGLLGGLSAEELAALRFSEVDLAANVARVPGVSTRSCTLRDPLRRLLIERRSRPGAAAAPLVNSRGEPLTADDIEGLIACAAHDAGLHDAREVTAEVLRHTYFAYLVRQGVRLADMGEFIGRLAPAAFRDYAPLSPPGRGVPLEEIDPVYPPLRGHT